MGSVHNWWVLSSNSLFAVALKSLNTDSLKRSFFFLVLVISK